MSVPAGDGAAGSGNVAGRIFRIEAVAEPGHAIGGGRNQEPHASFPGGGVGGLPVEFPSKIGLGIGTDVQ